MVIKSAATKETNLRTLFVGPGERKEALIPTSLKMDFLFSPDKKIMGQVRTKSGHCEDKTRTKERIK